MKKFKKKNFLPRAYQLAEKIAEEFDDLDLQFRICAWPDKIKHCRTAAVIDNTGKPVATIDMFSFRYVVNSCVSYDKFDRLDLTVDQIRNFWLGLYDRYGVKRSVFYAKHDLKPVYRRIAFCLQNAC